MIKLNNILLEVASGDCYQAAGRLMTNLGSSAQTLVHGMVNGQGPLEGKRYGHAWVETSDSVLDHSNGKKLEIPKELYYAIGGIREEDNKYYDKDETLKWILKTKHWGPWEMSGATIDMYEDIPTDQKEVGKEEMPVDKADMTKLMPMLKEIGEASAKPFPFKLILGKSAEEHKATNDGYDFEMAYEFTTDKGTKYIVTLDMEHWDDGIRGDIDFGTQTAGGGFSYDDTNKQEVFRVMSTIKDIIFEFIEEWQDHYYIHNLEISPIKSTDGDDDDNEDPDLTVNRRGKLYLAYMRKNLSDLSKPYGVRVYTDYFHIEPLFDKPL